MITSIILCLNEPPIWFIYASGFASVIALLFVILYFIKPSLEIIDESFYSPEENKIRIKCINRNFFKIIIKDVRCDIVSSQDMSFKKSDTLLLLKDSIPGIGYNDNYIFKVKEVPKNLKNKHYLKVRILALNILGITKFYQKVFEIKS